MDVEEEKMELEKDFIEDEENNEENLNEKLNEKEENELSLKSLSESEENELLENELSSENSEELNNDFDSENEMEKTSIEKKDELEEKKKKKKTQKQKQKEFIKKEQEIKKAELRLLNSENILEKEDDYESSQIWVHYIAFKMEKDGLIEARKLLERALRTINFREEIEKLNIWTAFLNLEFNFGNEEDALKVFQRACNSADPKKVYFRMIDILKKGNKFDISKCWIEYLKNVFEYNKINKNKIDVKQELTRALQSLNKKKHIKILSQYGRLQYLYDEPEKGRTSFEAILNNFAKRTDIWSMYLDMELKYGNSNSIRDLFERCISLNLKPRKMKFFFKRYLEFEIMNGNEKKIEYVKEKANEFVEKFIEKKENFNENEFEENE